MFRPVNRSSSGLQQNKSKVLLRNWNPNVFIGAIGFIFRPINRSSPGLQQNKSKVMLRIWDPNVFYSCKQI